MLHHKLMSSGNLVNLLDPDPTTIFFSDISDSLGRIYRHGGQGVNHVSIAHHTCLGVYILREMGASERVIRLWLLHDFHEVFIGEIITPMKDTIAMIAGFDVIKEIERKFDAVFYSIAQIGAPMAAEKETLKLVDRATCLFEAKHIAKTDWTQYGWDLADIEIAENTFFGEHFEQYTTTSDWCMTLNNMVLGYLPRMFDWIGCDGRAVDETPVKEVA